MSGAPDPRPVKRLSRSDASRLTTADYRRAWKQAVLNRDQGCFWPNPNECRPPFVAHHVLYAQAIRRDPTVERFLYDSRVGMGCCDKHHAMHHSGDRRIRLDEIPAVVREFVTRLGYGWYLDRRYTVTP